jgi:SAM-dependent methyltransferase
MSKETYQLSDNAAAVYEDQKVPAIFAPLAEATLGAIRIAPHDTILDVACGTGIVARLVRDKLGPKPRIVGADLNAGMIAQAQSLPDVQVQSIEWEVADASDLPFAGGSFSVVICQQGIQFFPDELAALREMKRVLRPGGLIALSVWTGPNEFFMVLAAALGRHVSDEVGKRSLAPFSYDGGDQLGNRLVSLGFADVSTNEISVNRIIADPKTAIPKEILANPVGALVAERGEAVMKRIVADVTAEMAYFRDGSALVVPQHSYLVQGIVP